MASPGFFNELKRRQIYRGGVMYVVAGWVIVQVATTIFPLFSIPDWAIRLVVVVIMLGFPLALVGLWMFDSSGRLVQEAATQPDPVHARAPTPGQAEGGERRRGADRSSEALAQLMEEERLERQRSNEKLLAALGEIKAGASDAAPAPHPTTPITHFTPTAMPAYYPMVPAKRGVRIGTLLLGLFVLVLAGWGTWLLISPSIDAEALAGTDKLTHRYVMPAYKEIEQLGASLLTPLLQKLGIHIAPERVFTSLMLVLALLVLRNLYFKMGDARRRARRVHGR